MARKNRNTRDGIYERKDRKGFWISWNDAQGRRRYRKTDAQTITQAKQIRAAELVRVEQARALGFTPPGTDTFAQVATRFLTYQKARLTPKAYERERSIVELHLKPFFACKLSAVQRNDIQRYVTTRSGKVSAHSVQKELNILKHLLRLAVEWEVIPFQPSQGVKSPRVPAGRVRYLQPAELQAVIQAGPSSLGPIVAIAVSTGMRRSEVLGLRWMDLDLVHDRVMLSQTKNGEGRIVYLNKAARAAIRSLLFGSETKPLEKLFTGITHDQVSTAFRRACKSAKIIDFRFHDLRHTAASWLRMAGADIHTVAQLLGHKDLRMAARYQHLSPDFLANAVGRLDAVFGELRYQDVTTPKALILESPVTC
jgi:integrase